MCVCVCVVTVARLNQDILPEYGLLSKANINPKSTQHRVSSADRMLWLPWRIPRLHCGNCMALYMNIHTITKLCVAKSP